MIFRGTRLMVIAALASSVAAQDAALPPVETDFGVPQAVSPEVNDAVTRHLAGCDGYMKKLKETDPVLHEGCKNTHELCAQWAVAGACETEKEKMVAMCRPACNACEVDASVLVEKEEDVQDEEEEQFEERFDEEEEEEEYDEEEEEYEDEEEAEEEEGDYEESEFEEEDENEEEMEEEWEEDATEEIEEGEEVVAEA
jgi:hypothetical protein